MVFYSRCQQLDCWPYPGHVVGDTALSAYALGVSVPLLICCVVLAGGVSCPVVSDQSDVAV